MIYGHKTHYTTHEVNRALEDIDNDDITLVPEPSHERLLPRQQEAYKLHRKQLLKWALDRGKDPANGDGYAHETVRSRAYRLDEFYRWVWEHEDGYTTNITADHATRL